jgi:hypothetical protein
MNKRYCVVPALTETQPADAFLNRIYTEVPADNPAHPTCFEGEWVCPHAPCPVRAVRVRVKAQFYRHLPRLRCPLCLRQLDFRCWLNVIALQEVPAERQPSRTARVSPTRRATARPRKKRSLPGADTPTPA